jgi:hypothetical protein
VLRVSKKGHLMQRYAADVLLFVPLNPFLSLLVVHLHLDHHQCRCKARLESHLQ